MVKSLLGVIFHGDFQGLKQPYHYNTYHFLVKPILIGLYNPIPILNGYITLVITSTKPWKKTPSPGSPVQFVEAMTSAARYVAGCALDEGSTCICDWTSESRCCWLMGWQMLITCKNMLKGSIEAIMKGVLEWAVWWLIPISFLWWHLNSSQLVSRLTAVRPGAVTPWLRSSPAKREIRNWMMQETLY